MSNTASPCSVRSIIHSPCSLRSDIMVYPRQNDHPHTHFVSMFNDPRAQKVNMGCWRSHHTQTLTHSHSTDTSTSILRMFVCVFCCTVAYGQSWSFGGFDLCVGDWIVARLNSTPPRVYTHRQPPHHTHIPTITARWPFALLQTKAGVPLMCLHCVSIAFVNRFYSVVV